MVEKLNKNPINNDSIPPWSKKHNIDSDKRNVHRLSKNSIRDIEARTRAIQEEILGKKINPEE